MRFSSISVRLKFILFCHIFNPFWYSREKRRKIRTDYILKTVDKHFRPYLKSVDSVPEIKVITDDKNEKIFSIWLQGEEKAPELIKSCFRSIRRHCKQELIVLDEQTLFKYIKLPDIIMEKRRKGMIKNAHFADICRVELLYQYGGIWLDATDFVTAPIPKQIIDSDFFMYLVNPEWGFGYSFVQNCFIRAKKGAFLLAAWRAMIFDYWTHENYDIDYFIHQLLFRSLVKYDARAKKYFDEMPHLLQDETHALWWGYKDKPYDEKLFDSITKGAFFQKTTYRGLDNVIPGSFAEKIINAK